MDKIMMWLMAFAAFLGGLDRLVGNRLGLGKRFEEGCMLLGPTALSMAGLICVTPLLSMGMQATIVPLFSMLHLDPGMLGGILAIDMGGYQLAKELAQNSSIGSYAGLIVSATLGCTITFTIPVGMGMLEAQEKTVFAKGMLLGLATLPIGLFLGGIGCGVTIPVLIVQSIPVLILAVLLILGLQRFPSQMIHGFSVFASLIQAVGTIGLTIGAFSYMTGRNWIPGMTSLEEAMKVVSSIGIVLLGSLPFAAILQRILKKPLLWIGKKVGLDEASTAGLLIGIVSPLPVIADMKKMNRKGAMVNAAFLVCGTSAVAAHLGFVLGVEPSGISAMFGAKIVGGLVAAAAAVWYAGKNEKI